MLCLVSTYKQFTHIIFYFFKTYRNKSDPPFPFFWGYNIHQDWSLVFLSQTRTVSDLTE